MADRIVGQATNFTTVSAGGGGNVRVTYAPWELDWEFFDAIAVGHWMANVTTATSDDIVAKGGSEHLGYWFEVSTAFPSANWNTGNRISPQRQAAINQHNTIAAAVAAAANNDIFLMWYRTTSNRRLWGEFFNFANKGCGIWGMLSRRQITLTGSPLNLINYTGNLIAQNVQLPVYNLTVTSVANFNIAYNPTAGQAGAGLRVERVTIFGGGSGIVIAGTTLANTVVFRQCSGLFLDFAFVYIQGQPQAVEFCSAFKCLNGFYFPPAQNAPGRNLVAGDCRNCFSFSNLCQNCADTDGTLPVHATNLRNRDVRTQLRFFYDLARPGSKAFCHDLRVVRDSVLSGAGVAIAGAPRDGDGRLRPDPPSIGAWEPYAPAYAPGAELIRPALRGPAVGA